ncbi:hypothetical protein GCM10022238_25510 [Gordonia hankookensis]
MVERDVTSVNEWPAYDDAGIARGLISGGVPEDEAASTITGVMTGGTAGAVIAAAGAVLGGTLAYALGAALVPTRRTRGTTNDVNVTAELGKPTGRWSTPLHRRPCQVPALRSVKDGARYVGRVWFAVRDDRDFERDNGSDDG